MRDFIPTMSHKYKPMADWHVTQEQRERMLARSRLRDGERWDKGTKPLEDIPEGSLVLIQNQTGNNPKRWDKTGTVIEKKKNSQLLIKVDGSRRVTLRNRKFVKPLISKEMRLRKPVMSNENESIDVVEPVEKGVNRPDSELSSPEQIVEGEPPSANDDNNDNLDVPTIGYEAPVADPLVDVPRNEVNNDALKTPRPKRIRKPNSRYPSEDYDLSG